MSERPTLALAMVPMFTTSLFDEESKARLRAVCDVPDPEPLVTFEEARAQELLKTTDILLTSWGCPPIDRHVLERAPRLRAIVHAAGTVKSHVTDDCWDRAIAVSSAAAANAVPVAEYTLAAVLFANKKIFGLRHRYAQARSFRWWPSEFPGLGNYRKTVGIVGASFVGRRVIELLRPFDMTVLVYDPYLAPAKAEALGAKPVELDDLLRASDVVSLHAPATPETHQMIDRRRLALLRDGTTLINTARGWLVDGDALADELVAGRIDAVLDTTEPEVLPESSPLYELPNVFLTPHVAGAMGTETQRMGALAVDEIERFARGEPFLHGIRREDLSHIA
jgi:phosphoglycerate dehydrogenase-like enzyme